MDREGLRRFSREELIDLVLRLQDLAGVAMRQQVLVEQLTARVAELGAEVARLDGPPKTPGNSSVPPSHGFNPNRAEWRAQARPEAGASREQPSAAGAGRGRALPPGPVRRVWRVACRWRASGGSGAAR